MLCTLLPLSSSTPRFRTGLQTGLPRWGFQLSQAKIRLKINTLSLNLTALRFRTGLQTGSHLTALQFSQAKILLNMNKAFVYLAFLVVQVEDFHDFQNDDIFLEQKKSFVESSNRFYPLSNSLFKRSEENYLESWLF